MDYKRNILKWIILIFNNLNMFYVDIWILKETRAMAYRLQYLNNATLKLNFDKIIEHI